MKAPKKVKVRPYVPKFGAEEIVEVPAAGYMDDETFLRHLELRHASECKFEKTPVARHAMDKWLPVYRAFHARLHSLETPGQYDHEHEED